MCNSRMTPAHSPLFLTHCFWGSNHSERNSLHITNEKNHHVRYSYVSLFIKSHNLIFLFRLYHFRINNHVLTLSLVAGSFKYQYHHHHHHHHHHHPGRPLKHTEYWKFLCVVFVQTWNFAKWNTATQTCYSTFET